MVGVPASETRAIDSASFQASNQSFALLNLVNLKVASGRRIDLVMGEQSACVAGVLCSNQIHLFEGPQRTECDVLQIADRCTHNV